MLSSSIENLLNRNLPRSPRARELCASLAGRRVAVEIRGVRQILIHCTGERLEIDRSGAAADLTVSGGPVSLAACALGTAAGNAIEGVEVSGDRGLAERFGELARLLKPDVEEELALAIGDVPAHELARISRAALGWSRRAAETAVRNVAEYLAHERRDLVSRSEARALASGIESVRDAVERLQARADALARRHAAEPPQPREP